MSHIQESHTPILHRGIAGETESLSMTWGLGPSSRQHACEVSSRVWARRTVVNGASFRKAAGRAPSLVPIWPVHQTRLESTLKFRRVHQTLFSRPQPASTISMASSQQQKGRDGVLSALDVLIQALNLAKDSCGIPPAQVALGSAAILLTMIRVRFFSFLENGLLTRGHPRTRWPTPRTTSTLRGLVGMYAKCSIGN